MMKTFPFLILFFLSIVTGAQTPEPIVVTTQNIFIPGALVVASWKSEHNNQQYPDYPKFYYGFAEGDEISLDFTMENKKGTNQIEISEYESKSVVYSNKEFQTLDGIKIKVPKTAVYKFEFSTNHMFDRNCKVTVKRIPGTVATKNFNSNVTWKTVNDTTFTTETQKVKVSSKYEPVTIQTPIDYFVNSTSNETWKGGSSRLIFPIILPENTVEWYYTIGATRTENAIKNTMSEMKLFKDVAMALDKSGILSFGIGMLTQPPGADYCDIYLMSQEFAQPFKNGTQFSYIGEGTRENLMSGLLKIKTCCQQGTYYFGIRNRDEYNGVHVAMEIVAVVEKATYESLQVKKPLSIESKKIPVFGN